MPYRRAFLAPIHAALTASRPMIGACGATGLSPSKIARTSSQGFRTQAPEHFRHIWQPRCTMAMAASISPGPVIAWTGGSRRLRNTRRCRLLHRRVALGVSFSPRMWVANPYRRTSASSGSSPVLALGNTNSPALNRGDWLLSVAIAKPEMLRCSVDHVAPAMGMAA